MSSNDSRRGLGRAGESLLSLEHLSHSRLPFKAYSRGERDYANEDL